MSAGWSENQLPKHTERMLVGQSQNQLPKAHRVHVSGTERQPVSKNTQTERMSAGWSNKQLPKAHRAHVSGTERTLSKSTETEHMSAAQSDNCHISYVMALRRTLRGWDAAWLTRVLTSPAQGTGCDPSTLQTRCGGAHLEHPHLGGRGSKSLVAWGGGGQPYIFKHGPANSLNYHRLCSLPACGLSTCHFWISYKTWILKKSRGLRHLLLLQRPRALFPVPVSGSSPPLHTLTVPGLYTHKYVNSYFPSHGNTHTCTYTYT